MSTNEFGLTDEFPQKIRTWIVVWSTDSDSVVYAVRGPYQDPFCHRTPLKLRKALERRYRELWREYEDRLKYDIRVERGSLDWIRRAIPQVCRPLSIEVEDLVVPS